MRVRFVIACPDCDSEALDAGPTEQVGGRVSRIALACRECPWIGQSTVTLTKTPRGQLDHLQDRLPL